MSDSLWPHGLYSTRLLCPWNSPEKNTRVGSHSLLQENFPTPGSNPGLSRCRRFFYHLSHPRTFSSMNLHWSQLLMMSSRLIWHSLIDMAFIDRHPAWSQLSYLGFMTLWNFPNLQNLHRTLLSKLSLWAALFPSGCNLLFLSHRRQLPFSYEPPSFRLNLITGRVGGR